MGGGCALFGSGSQNKKGGREWIELSRVERGTGAKPNDGKDKASPLPHNKLLKVCTSKIKTPKCDEFIRQCFLFSHPNRCANAWAMPCTVSPGTPNAPSALFRLPAIPGTWPSTPCTRSSNPLPAPLFPPPNGCWPPSKSCRRSCWLSIETGQRPQVAGQNIATRGAIGQRVANIAAIQGRQLANGKQFTAIPRPVLASPHPQSAKSSPSLLLLPQQKQHQRHV